MAGAVAVIVDTARRRNRRAASSRRTFMCAAAGVRDGGARQVGVISGRCGGVVVLVGGGRRRGGGSLLNGSGKGRSGGGGRARDLRKALLGFLGEFFHVSAVFAVRSVEADGIRGVSRFRQATWVGWLGAVWVASRGVAWRGAAVALPWLLACAARAVDGKGSVRARARRGAWQ